MMTTSDSPKYEWLITYKNPKIGLFNAPNGRRVKRTEKAKNEMVNWCRARGYDVTVKRRTVGPWMEET
jgi:hypothetical protein